MKLHITCGVNGNAAIKAFAANLEEYIKVIKAVCGVMGPEDSVHVYQYKRGSGSAVIKVLEDGGLTRVEDAPGFVRSAMSSCIKEYRLPLEGVCYGERVMKHITLYNHRKYPRKFIQLGINDGDYRTPLYNLLILMRIGDSVSLAGLSKEDEKGALDIIRGLGVELKPLKGYNRYISDYELVLRHTISQSD